MRKRIALAVTTPVGILSSTLSMTETQGWCIIILIISVVLFIFWIYTILKLRNNKKKCGLSEYGLLLAILVMTSTSITRLIIMDNANKRMTKWLELQSTQIHEQQNRESKILSNNSTDEIYHLAQNHSIGINGFEKNFQKTEKYLQMASDRGHLLATRKLAEMYLKGYGCNPDFERAYALYIDNVKKGDLLSADALEKMVYGDSLQTLRLRLDLKDYYNNKQILNNITEYLDSKYDTSFIDNMDSQIYNQLTCLSDRGFILADKILYVVSIIGNSEFYDETKAEKYAKRLFNKGVMPDFPMDQYSFIRAMEPSYSFITFDSKCELAVKYNYCCDLMSYSSERYTSASEYINSRVYTGMNKKFTSRALCNNYQYSYIQFKKSEYNLKNFETLSYICFPDSKEEVINDYLFAKEALQREISLIEKLLGSYYLKSPSSN